MSTFVRIGQAMNRRALLRLALLGAAAGGAAGCSLVRTGTVTTATIDVDQLVRDGDALLRLLNSALAVPGVGALLGVNLAAAESALTAAGVVMNQIVALVGDKITLSIDTARVKALVLSLLGDAQTALTLLLDVHTSGQASGLLLLIEAATTLVPLVQQAAGLASVLPRLAPMSEAEALSIAARN